jgi:hypothetical protein
MHQRNLYVKCCLNYYHYMWKRRLIYHILMCLAMYRFNYFL